MAGRLLTYLSDPLVKMYIDEKLLKRICEDQAARRKNAQKVAENAESEDGWDSLEIGKWRIQERRPYSLKEAGLHLPEMLLHPEEECRIFKTGDELQTYGRTEEFLSLFETGISERKSRLYADTRGYALVFTGGGGKGAFEIGVWKFLHEKGIDKKITGLSGASVGALNSLLFVGGSYELAKDIWERIEQEDMTPVNNERLLDSLRSIMTVTTTKGRTLGQSLSEKIKNLPDKMQELPDKAQALSEKMQALPEKVQSLPEKVQALPEKMQEPWDKTELSERFHQFLEKIQSGREAGTGPDGQSGLESGEESGVETDKEKAGEQSGIFSQKKLEELIENNVDWEQVKNSGITAYCSLSAVIQGLSYLAYRSADNPVLGFLRALTQAEYCCWTLLPTNEIKDFILASASLPIAYGARDVDGREFLDGSINDNCPVRPLVEAGFKKIIVVHLRMEESPETDPEWLGSIKDLNIDGVRFYHIYPEDEYYNDYSEIMKVNPEVDIKRMEEGYRAAEHQLPESLWKQVSEDESAGGMNQPSE